MEMEMDEIRLLHYYLENSKSESRSSCLRRSGFAQAGETNPKYKSSNFQNVIHSLVLNYVLRSFEFRASNLDIL